MDQKKIFIHLAESLTNILPNTQKFESAVLEIMRLEGVVEYTGYYFEDLTSQKHWLDIFNLNIDDNYIEKLYEITQNETPIHANWNRAVFTLYPEGKVNMKYSWDQELQDEVDGYNNAQL